MSELVAPERDAVQLMRLLQLSSPALPIGAYSYSQGLEASVEAKQVIDLESAADWIEAMLKRVMARNDAVVIALSFKAFAALDEASFCAINAFHMASRETRSARSEARQMGWSLRKLSCDLGWLAPKQNALLGALQDPSYAASFAACVVGFGLPLETALSAFLFSWLENQVIAAQKLLAIGQGAGQRMLYQLAGEIPLVCKEALGRATAGLAGVDTLAPHLAILACRHEAQYSRIFRT